MSLTLTLSLPEATWADLRKYVECNDKRDPDEFVGFSALSPDGEINPELYEQVR